MLRNALTNTILALLSLVIFCIFAESIIRGIQTAGWLTTIDPAAYKAQLKQSRRLNAKLIKSENPVLFVEYDTSHREINAAGYRGTDFQKEKTPNTFRIAILGDSVGYGYNVPYSETFSFLLEKNLNQKINAYPDSIYKHYEVLNFSVSGYGTEAEAELYKTKVHSYNPDLVLLVYVLNDPIPTKMLFESVSSSRKGKQSLLSLASKSQFLGWLTNTFNAATKTSRVKANYKNYYTSAEHWSKVQQAIKELSLETSKNNSKLATIIFPLLLDFNDYPLQKYHDMVARELGQYDIPQLDLLQAYRAVNVNELKHSPEDTTHPNALGHKIAAGSITNFLINNNLVVY